jgi:hypothetical protein
MSLTDAAREERLRRFYDRRIQPAADRIRARGSTFFPMAPDPRETSYYKDVSGGRSYVHELRSEDLESHLRQYWSEAGLPELAEISGELVKLAVELERTDPLSAEVSSLVYAMF